MPENEIIPTRDSSFEDKETFLTKKWVELRKIANELGCSYTSFFSYGPIRSMIINKFTIKEYENGFEGDPEATQLQDHPKL